ncbi:NAD(P)-dependent oxidoreductase [Actinomadura logoneensis]|uniref:NAD(P)-dependent oxidoreductase n=1 Tax=Actinomadura logoneensis TaxID=2293572 RepID=A0A372JCZ7_9ACTN|nr:NAD(P)-dependent oxidoreductase [Actinomadura logoneensis]RFU37789.1 NAD(P)-dependent oxidoreductase [Actinomadura logoneensis]
MTAVALLGTGIMGFPMARNLLRAGVDLTVWNRTRARAEPLAEEGARVADSPGAAVADADVIVTMMTDGDVVAEVMEAAAPRARRGAVWAQMSTVGVAALGPLAELAGRHGLTFVDAPVQGSRQPAEEGKLVVLAAGPESAREAVRPVFDAVGQRTMWLGDDGAAGAGTRLKMVTVGYAITLTSLVAESLALAEGLGLDPRAFGEVLTGGPLDCGYLQTKMRAVLERDFSPTFTVRNASKDTGLIMEAASSAGVRVDLTDAARQRFLRATEQGHGEEDMVASFFAGFPS